MKWLKESPTNITKQLSWSSKTLTLELVGARMFEMSKVDFMFGVVTSLIAETLFHSRHALIIYPAKRLATVIQNTIQNAEITFPSLISITGPALTTVLLVSVLNVSTQTALAPSQPRKITESVWTSERTGTIYTLLSDEDVVFSNLVVLSACG